MFHVSLFHAKRLPLILSSALLINLFLSNHYHHTTIILPSYSNLSLLSVMARGKNDLINPINELFIGLFSN